MKHEPNGREKSETARDWDPRAHEQTARDWDPRTHEQTARVGTPGPMIERAMPTAGKQKCRCPRATRGRNKSQCNSWRRQLIECTVQSIPRLLRRIKQNDTLLLKNLNKVEYLESWGSAFDTEVSLKNANPSRT